MCHIKHFLQDFNVNVGWDNTFKPDITNECSYDNINNNEVRLVNFATFKNLTVKKLFHMMINKSTI
jgi:hypothetical protein